MVFGTDLIIGENKLGNLDEGLVQNRSRFERFDLLHEAIAMGLLGAFGGSSGFGSASGFHVERQLFFFSLKWGANPDCRCSPLVRLLRAEREAKFLRGN